MLKLILFACSVLPMTLMAQTSGELRSFTLAECLKIAADQNYDIRTAAAQFQAQSANTTQAFGAFLPTISASAGYARQKGALIYQGQVLSSAPAVDYYTLGANASLNIFNGFERESNYQRTQLELDAADYNYRRVRQTVSYNVRSQYIDVLKAMQVSKIRKENFELGQKELERMRALYDAGRVPVANVYSQEADLGTRELEVVNAENAENQSKARLLSTLSLPPDQRSEFFENAFPMNVDESIMADFRKEIGSYNAASTEATKRRDDFQASTSRMQASKSSVTAARSGYMPSLNASGGWSSSNTELANFGDRGRYSLGLNLSVPIFDNFTTSTQVQIAQLQVQQREIERAQTEQRIRSEVQSAFLNLDAAEKQLDITQRVIKSSTQNFEAVRERLNVGAATVLDYQTANNQLVSAKINRASAVYGYFNAQSQLRYALGTLKDN